jgi:hypothetical protein
MALWAINEQFGTTTYHRHGPGVGVGVGAY